MDNFKIRSISIYVGDDRENELRAYCNFKSAQNEEIRIGLVYLVKADKHWWQTTDGKPIKTVSLADLFAAMKESTFVTVKFDQARDGLPNVTISQ